MLRINKSILLMPASVLALPLLTACSGLKVSKEECLNTDWAAEGHADAKVGYSKQDDQRMVLRDTFCKKYDVVVLEKYIEGYNQQIEIDCAVNRWVQRGAYAGESGDAQNSNDHAGITRCHDNGRNVQQQYEEGFQKGVKKYCAASDKWYQKAANEGAAGNAQPVAELPEIKLCEQYGHSIKKVYTKGRKAGYKKYCTAENLERIGSAGNIFPPVCQGTPTVSWQRGVSKYCSPNRGLTTGSAGSKPDGICDRRHHPEYFNAWKTGVEAYCSDSTTGFRLGKQGQSVEVTCPGGAMSKFMRAYEDGKETASLIRRYEYEQQQTADDIERSQRKIKNLEYEINNGRNRLISLKSDKRQEEQKIETLNTELQAKQCGINDFDCKYQRSTIEYHIRVKRGTLQGIERDIDQLMISTLPRLQDEISEKQHALLRHEQALSEIIRMLDQLEAKRGL